jgi:addiction module HigA family antidote
MASCRPVANRPFLFRSGVPGYYVTEDKIISQKKTERIPFPHPGETIHKDFLKPLGMSVNNLAMELHIPATRMMEIIHGRRGITADTALRLARYFNTTPKFWLNLQASYDLAVATATLALKR